MIIIKPHHFMDIIKLYGSGIKEFVPDPNNGHDFYRVANEIVGNKNVSLRLTTGADDICGPCRHMGENGVCGDSISHIKGISSKDQYNKQLDERILKELGLSIEIMYSAKALCRCMTSRETLVFDVWREEARETTEKRNRLFQAGANLYMEGAAL